MRAQVTVEYMPLSDHQRVIVVGPSEEAKGLELVEFSIHHNDPEFLLMLQAIDRFVAVQTAKQKAVEAKANGGQRDGG